MSDRPGPHASQPRFGTLRRGLSLLALLPLLAGIALIPAFLAGALPGMLAPATYVGLVGLAVLVGSAAVPGGHLAVPISGLVASAASGAWIYAQAQVPDVSMADLTGAWASLPRAGALPSGSWSLLIAVPAALVLLWSTVRGEDPLPMDPGDRGLLEGLPGRPALFGLVALLVGIAGTLFAGSTFLEKIAVVAPIFEEYAKLGVALLLLASLGLSRGGPAFALGSLSGLAFALLEHHLTYSSETELMFLVRGLFHTLAAGLSALVYVHLRRRENLAPGVGWFAIAPSALVHAANNVFAVGTALAGLIVELPDWFSPLVGSIFVATLVVLVIVTFGTPQAVAGRIERGWHRLNGEADRVRSRLAGPR